MARKKQSDTFWLSYSDLMTSLFFIMLVLFIVCIIKMKVVNNELANALGEKEATIEQLNRILQLDAQFSELSKSSTLRYVEDKKMFVAKDFENIEIFNPYTSNTTIAQASIIKPGLLPKGDQVGRDLEALLSTLHEQNPNFSYQLVIEGTAAIPWDKKVNHTFNPDNELMYNLSYNRALALYNRWKANGLNLRKYNTEIIIAGSGFNGLNRDEQNEDNNKRFFIQIIPKINRPEVDNSSNH